MGEAMPRTAPPAVPAAPTFEAFFVAHKQDVYAAMWLVTRNSHDAEEITQDAFVRVLDRWNHVGSLDDPLAYVIATAMNVWRARGRRAAVLARKVLHTRPPADIVAAIDDRDVVLRALAGLTARERAAVVLTALLDLTSEEAARALGVRASTVRVLAARGKARLRDQIEEKP